MEQQPNKIRERQIARKHWIREVTTGEMKTADGIEPNLLVTGRGQTGRINIIGVVIQREELPVPSILVDDGTDQILCRRFEGNLKQNVGAFVQLVGRPRIYQGQLYVAIEAISTVHPGWADYRKRELGAVKEVTPLPSQSVISNGTKVIGTPTKDTDENKSERIVRLIKEHDKGDGADIDIIINASKLPNAEELIDRLLLSGDIFELRPGKLKVL